jgi:hypothetical protein
LPLPYNLRPNSKYSYEFVTDQGNKYLVYFIDSSNIFEGYPNVGKDVYSFNIEVKDGNADISTGDERIGITILEVFKIFFTNFENVAVYICDTMDSRQQSRHRKFSIWFWRFNDGSIIKEDAIAVADDVYVYNSILVHKNNPRLQDIISAFKELNADVNDK